VDGRLTISAGADAVRDKVRSLLQRGVRSFVVDLAAVPYMDSAGPRPRHLGPDLHHGDSPGRRARVAARHHRLPDLLVITKLLTVFDCYDSEAAALAGVAGEGVGPT
jgi:anti-sigma B factor antagonist